MAAAVSDADDSEGPNFFVRRPNAVDIKPTRKPLAMPGILPAALPTRGIISVKRGRASLSLALAGLCLGKLGLARAAWLVTAVPLPSATVTVKVTAAPRRAETQPAEPACGPGVIASIYAA